MLNCDEIILELSREQAVSSNGSATWSNIIPDLILEEGDAISCEGGWISVSNSGDNSIEVVDKQNPDKDVVDASFYVSYYKVMDTKNVVAMPYHSLKLTLSDDNELGVGFKKSLPISDNNLEVRYFGVPSVNTGSIDEPTYVNITEISTYESLVHTSDSDRWDSTLQTYEEFITNASFTQGTRDSANTGNYYTALYRKENGGYDLLQRKVDVVIPKGYYSPDNLASFITEQLQTKYFNDSVGNNPPETWTNSGRYVVGMTPVATPQINLGLGSAMVDKTTGREDFLSTNSAPADYQGVGGIDVPITMATATGFTNYYPNLKITNMFSPDNFDTQAEDYQDLYPISSGGTRGINGVPTYGQYATANYITFEYKPTAGADFNDWLYLLELANNWSGLSSKFFKETGTYIPTKGYENGFQLYCAFLLNNTPLSDGELLGAGIWTGSIYNTIRGDGAGYGYKYNHPEITEDILPIMYDEATGIFTVRTCITLYNTTAINNAGTQYIELVNVSPARQDTVIFEQGYTWDAITYPNFADQYPNGIIIDGGVLISAGGISRFNYNYQPYQPYRYNYRLPIGCPLYIGMARIEEVGGWVDTTLVNNASGLAWSAFQNDASTYSWYSPNSLDRDTITPPIPYDTPPTARVSTTGNRMDYKNGNQYLGMTCANFNRWSLKNNDEPPPVLTTPETEPNVMPILRKYPLFMKTGMDTNTTAYLGPITETQIDLLSPQGIILDADGYVSSAGVDGFALPQVIYPDFIDTTLTNIKLSSAIKVEGRFIFTNNVYNKLLPSGMTAVEAWYRFIEGQIQDGLIDIDAGTHTYNNIEYFYAYSHLCLSQEGTPITEAVPLIPLNYEGSDDAIRNRPRGLIIRIHKASFLNPAKNISASSIRDLIPALIATSPQPFFSRGMLIAGMTADTMKLGCSVYSWVADKIMGHTYGFDDYNTVPNGIITMDLTLPLKTLQETGVLMGWGYSYKKTGWRNFTAMLCSYALEESDATSFMFNSTSNRMDKNANRFNPNNPDATSWGSLSYNPRIYLGADQANLSFDGDGSSRFYWSNFFLTNKIGNKYYEGTENSTGGTLQLSVQRPFYTVFGGFAEGVSATPNGTDLDWSSDIPANSEAGTEIIEYNKSKRSLYNDGLFQLAPEMTKHLPLILEQTGNSSEQGSYVSGNQFNYVYPVDTNYTTRFFCFDADVRYNSWLLGQYTYDHTVVLAPTVATFPDLCNPYVGITPTTWAIKEADDQQPAGKYLTPSFFWGCMSGDDGFIEKTSEAGTCRPNPKVIYDSVGGVQVFDWGDYTRENWTDSFWDIIGFNSTDMMPTPFQYCGQQRNFTTNFMTPSSSTFRTHSYPMRNDADLTDSGFVSTTTNIQGSPQYVLQYPRKNYISALGLQGINNLQQSAFTFVGISKPSGANFYVSTGSKYFPYNYSGWVEMANSGGGASYINGQLIPEEFAILYTQSTKNYASDVADKLQSPFYLVRCNLAEDNFKYTNNSVVPSIHPVMGVISKQYGATSDWYYSTDSVNMTFTNRRRRVLNEVKINITEKSGGSANNLQAKSTIFFKIRRADTHNQETGMVKGLDADTENLLAIEENMNKKQHDLYEEEIALLLKPLGKGF